MKLLSTLLASALLTVSAGAAMADNIASYGSTASTPTGILNSATTYAGGPTYDIPTGGIWAGPVGSSSWVGINPKDYPGGGHIEPNSTYTYTTSFTATSNEELTLTVLADDTTSIMLNGKVVVPPSSFMGAAHCVNGLPTCTTTDTVSFGGFTDGLNTLTFGVDQLFLNATGLDYSGNLAVTPEPSSLLLLGSGLTGMAGMFFRRRRQA